MEADKRIPTIKDIARIANVSTATVSRILNGQPGYGEDTKQRVEAAIAQQGYTRNAVARGLVQKRTNTIGILLPSLTSQFASELLNGIETEAHSHHYSAIVCNTDRNGQRTAEYLNVLAEKQVDGIVFISEFLTEEYESLAERLHIPIVLVSTLPMRYQTPYVRVDDEKASFAAVSYLIKWGHQRIGMVSGPEEDPIAGKLRINGYRNALKANGIQFRQEYISYGDFHFARGKQAAGRLIDNAPEVTAIFASSDEMAIGVISAAWERDRRIPEDLSVIGYDDTAMAMMTTPPLTAVRQPIGMMGSHAVRMLLEGRQEGVVLPFTISERSSVGSPKNE